jgi:lantibiotic biosynthesis protein
MTTTPLPPMAPSSGSDLFRDQFAMLDSRAEALSDNLAAPPPSVIGGDRSSTSPRWLGQSLARGAAGIAVLHGRRAASGRGEWNRVHAWLKSATRENLAAGGKAGLWYGATAVAFALDHAAPPGGYRRALTALDTAVAALTRARLDAAAMRIGAATRPALAEYDLVHGLSGLGAHLLHRDPHGDLLADVLDYLVQLTLPLRADDIAGTDVPGWWTSDPPSGQPAEAYPGGHANLGMAHGICGPLALLSLTMRRGITVPGQAEAIEVICQWLESWRHDAPEGPWWPERIGLAEHRACWSTQTGPARPSWCYGTPGLARALQFAGDALGDQSRRQAAEHALAACLSDPAQLARLIDPALCHGWAGVLLTTWHAAADAGSPSLASHLPRLAGAVLDQTNPTSPAAWALPGLINGNAGIALTLHTLTGEVSRGWETCLLIT